MTSETLLFINCGMLIVMLLIQSLINYRALRVTRQLAIHVQTMAVYVERVADLAERNSKIAHQLLEERDLLNEHAGFWFAEWLKVAGR